MTRRGLSWTSWTLHLGFSVLLLAAGSRATAQTMPVGSEFQINTYTTDTQLFPAVAASDDFVVVWSSRGSSDTDTDDLSIQGQRLTVNGMPSASEFQVNTYTTGSQVAPDVAMNTDGSFVVVWSSSGSNGTDTDIQSIQGRLFSSDGTPSADQFQVNTYTTSTQAAAAVATAGINGFVVVWQSFGSSGDDSSFSSVQGQRFSVDGMPLGSEFQINTSTTNGQLRPAVTMDEDGEFVVVWDSYVSDVEGYLVQGQRFAADGTPQGGEFQVNSTDRFYEFVPDVEMGTDGFVVAWTSGITIDSYSIEGQRFDADGMAVGSQFLISEGTTGQGGPQIAIEDNGEFFVSWGLFLPPTDEIEVLGRQLAADGTALAGELQINTYTTAAQQSPDVAITTSAIFLVIWQSDGSTGSDTDTFSVQGRLYKSSAIFADGFESGDVTAWSSSVP